MSEALQNSTGSIGTVSRITRYAAELDALLSGSRPQVITTTDETIEDPSVFALEKHLEDFLVQNWKSTELGKKYDIYEEGGESVGQQYPSDTGPIDILAISKDKKEILYPMKIEEQVAIYNEFTVNKNQSKYPGENILIFLKQIYDKRSDKKYDWVFATNVEEVLLENLVVTYKKRWRIETQFRVQDEARIRCKSKEMQIRYFFFLFEQMLQTIWICFYKDEVPFKKFIIELSNTAKKWVKQDKE